MNAPTLNSAFNSVYGLLGKLLDSAALDSDSEAKDCLEVFDQYNWLMAVGNDAARFAELKALGNAGEMALAELNEFMGMVSERGETHIYHAVYKGQNAIADLQAMQQACATVTDEYRAVAISIAHLTQGDTAAFDLAISGGETQLMKRDYGYFLKLLEEDDDCADNFNLNDGNYRHGSSETIKNIIQWAYSAGYRLIEFDCDAQALEMFPTFEW